VSQLGFCEFYPRFPAKNKGYKTDLGIVTQSGNGGLYTNVRTADIDGENAILDMGEIVGFIRKYGVK